MIEKNEPEKLTPDSRKSYDGSDTYMSENEHEFDATENPDRKVEETHEEEDDREVEQRRDKAEQQLKLSKLLRAIFSGVNRENSEEQNKDIVDTFVAFASSENTSKDVPLESKEKSEQQIHNVAKLLYIFAAPEHVTPHDSNEKVEEENAVRNLYDDLLDAVEVAGFDKEVVSEEVAKLAEEQPFIPEDDRFDTLEKYFKERIEASSEESLSELQESLSEITNTTDTGSEVNKNVNEAETVLDQMLDEVEVQHNTTEDLDNQERAFDKQFAEMIVRVFEAKAQGSLKELEPKEEVSIIQQEEQDAKQLMSILLSPKDSPARKRKLFAAMIESVDGETEQQTTAMREKLMHYAERAGLDPLEVAIEQAGISTEFAATPENINELETVVELSPFEQIVEDQIVTATAKEVETIRKAWEKILDSSQADSKMKEQAVEAIKVLGNIIQLKEMQAARDRGEIVDFSTLPSPINAEIENNGENDGEDGEELSAENKKNLAEIFRKILLSSRPNQSKEEGEAVTVILESLMAQCKTKEDRETVLAHLLSYFPNKKGQESAAAISMVGHIMNVSGAFGVNQFDLYQRQADFEGQDTSRESFDTFLEQSLNRARPRDLEPMKVHWQQIIDNTDGNAELKNQAQKTLHVLTTVTEKAGKGESTVYQKSRIVEQPTAAETKDELAAKRTTNKNLDDLTDNIAKVQDSDLQASLANLASRLKEPKKLSLNELDRLYTDLQIQIRLARLKVGKGGEEDSKLARPAGILLNAQLTQTLSDTGERAEFLKKVQDKVSKAELEYKASHNLSRYRPTAELTGMLTSGTDAYGRRSGEDFYLPKGNTARDVLEQSSTPSTSISNPKLEEKELATELLEAKKRLPEVFANEKELAAIQANLDSMVDRLQKMMSKSFTESDQNISLRNIPEYESLVNAIRNQREALAKLQGFEGYIQTKSEMDPALYDGYVHEVLGERMHRIKVYFGEEQPRKGEKEYTQKEIHRYYKELQRWTNIILNNDIRRNPQGVNKKDMLNLKNDRYSTFLKVASRKIKDEREIPANQQNILSDIDDLENANYLRYFQYNAYDPADPNKRVGIRYQPPKEMGNYQPESLNATMDVIAREFSTEKDDFKTDGNRELINAEGEFQYHNFNYWIRKKINEDVDYNKDGPINPFGKIIIKLEMGQISMYELLLLIPEYTSQRKFEIKMQNDREDEVYCGWGQKGEDPNFTWNELDYIAMEMEIRQMTHQLRVKFRPTSVSGNKEQYLGIMKELHHNNHWTRANNIFLLLGYASGSVDNAKEEFDSWKNEDTEKQGSLGKSMSDMLVAYNYLSEITDYNKITGTQKEKNFNENMFYRFLEPDGANRFLIKMAEGALGNNTDAKVHYAEFIRERLQSVADKYKRRDITDKQRKKIDQLMNERQPKKEKDDKTIEINFTENEHLQNFYIQVERDVLNNTEITDKEIARNVRDELVDNLESGYFDKVLNMEVARIAKWKEGENDGQKTGEDRVSSYRHFMVDADNPKIRFGDIVEKDENGNRYSMKDLLTSFDVDQIKLFDYKNNDPEDLDNPFRQYLNNSDVLRRKIDEFMDPGKHKRNHELFRRNERMMVAFTKHVTRLDRKNINHFRDANENEVTQEMVKRAMSHVVEKAYGINSDESTYAWWWVRDYIYLWGIGSSLDVDGIGFRWDGKIINPGKWRPRRQGKDGGGNPHTFDEFLAMSLPFLHHMQVSNLEENHPLGHRSVFSWMQGGEGGNITPRAVRKFDKRSNYAFEQNAEALYVDNALDNSSELIDLLAKTEFDVTSIVNFDVLGNVVFDYAKAREVFGKWRKAARYTYGKNSLDYREKIWVNGREKTLYEHYFGPKTRALNELITRETGRTRDFKYKDPADAVMMSIIAAEVYEHRKMFASGHHWSIQNVHELEKFLLEFMTEYKQQEDAHGTIKSEPNPGTLFTHKIFEGALKAYHTAYFKMYSAELGSTVGSGLLRGFWSGFKAYMTKGKWIY
jgi:hypothetical protein